MLNATLDTAGFGDLSDLDLRPDRRRDRRSGWLHGRGSADSKAAVAIFSHLLLEMRGRTDFAGRIGVLFDCDEHSGRFGGAHAFFDRAHEGRGPPRPDGVLIGYPGMDRIVNGCRGFLRSVLTIHGVAAHSGSSRQRGVNAISRAFELGRRFESLTLPRPDRSVPAAAAAHDHRHARRQPGGLLAGARSLRAATRHAADAVVPARCGRSAIEETPAWYYLGAYLALGLPWSPLLVVAIARAWSTPDRSLRFLLAWAALMAVPLSLSRGKIDYYLLPLLPPLSLAIGHAFAAERWRAGERHLARAVLLAAAATLLLLTRGPASLPRDWLPGPAVLAVAAGAAGAGAALCAWAAWKPHPLRTLGVLAGVAAALAFSLGTFFVPAFARAQPQGALLDAVRDELRYEPEAALVLCEDPARVQRAVLFEARRAGQERCDLWAAAAAAPALFLLDADEQQSVGRTLRGISAHRYLPADTLTLRGLLAPAPPGWLYLAANYPAESPTALRKEARDYKRAVLARRAERRAKEEAEAEAPPPPPR